MTTEEKAVILQWIDGLKDEECRQILIMPCEIAGACNQSQAYITMDFDDLKHQLRKAVKGLIV